MDDKLKDLLLRNKVDEVGYVLYQDKIIIARGKSKHQNPYVAIYYKDRYIRYLVNEREPYRCFLRCGRVDRNITEEEIDTLYNMLTQFIDEQNDRIWIPPGTIYDNDAFWSILDK